MTYTLERKKITGPIFLLISFVIFVLSIFLLLLFFAFLMEKKIALFLFPLSVLRLHGGCCINHDEDDDEGWELDILDIM